MHWAIGALVSTAAWVAATVVAKPVAAPEDEATPVVVVVLDGVRWQEVFDGVDSTLVGDHRGPPGGAPDLLPNVYAAIRTRGAILGAPGHGRTITASGPNFVSLPGYTEIFNGRPSASCQDNECDGTREPTIADEIRAGAARDSDVAVFASWERIRLAATRSPSHVVLSTGRTDVGGGDVLRSDPEVNETLERGRYADAYPGYGAFRPDRFTAALALRYLDAQRPAFLFVGLGEPDEYAHRGDYVGYMASLRFADEFIGQLLATLDRMGERGRRTLVLVTSDHGRASDYREHGAQFPESARVWLAAFGGPVRARGFAAAPQPRRLADIAPTIRAARAMKPDGEPSGGMPLSELFEDVEPSGMRAVEYTLPP